MCVCVYGIGFTIPETSSRVGVASQGEQVNMWLGIGVVLVGLTQLTLQATQEVRDGQIHTVSVGKFCPETVPEHLKLRNLRNDNKSILICLDKKNVTVNRNSLKVTQLRKIEIVTEEIKYE